MIGAWSTARLRIWHDELGWGVVDSPDTPGGCWVHFRAVEVRPARVDRRTSDPPVRHKPPTAAPLTLTFDDDLVDPRDDRPPASP